MSVLLFITHTLDFCKVDLKLLNQTLTGQMACFLLVLHVYLFRNMRIVDQGHLICSQKRSRVPPKTGSHTNLGIRLMTMPAKVDVHALTREILFVNP